MMTVFEMVLSGIIGVVFYHIYDTFYTKYKYLKIINKSSKHAKILNALIEIKDLEILLKELDFEEETKEMQPNNTLLCINTKCPFKWSCGNYEKEPQTDKEYKLYKFNTDFEEVTCDNYNDKRK